VRLIGVDTPEVYGQAECYGHEASAFVERLLPLGSRVSYRLGVDPRDRYGRALAYVYLEDGRLLNVVLLRRGYAQPMTIPPNVELAGRFRRRRAGRPPARRRPVGAGRLSLGSGAPCCAMSQARTVSSWPVRSVARGRRS
jgi:micrococcal nuclease